MLLFTFWEVFSHSYESLRFILPPPSKITEIVWMHADRFAFHSFATFKEMLGGVAFALIVALPLAWLMSLFGPLRNMLQPIFIAIQCIPMFALAPIMVFWFDWSFLAIAVPISLMIFLPLTICIYKGLCDVPEAFSDFFLQYQATTWQTFYKLQLPCAMTAIFSGLRIAIAMAGIGAVAAEWAGAQEGLGLLMLESRRSADIEMMFGAIFCVTAINLGLYGGIVLIEKTVKKSYPNMIKSSFFVCIMIMLAFSGCKKAPEKSTTIVLDWLPNPNHIPLYAGIELGFFKNEGINLRILKVIDPGDGLPYLTSMQADLCLTYMPHCLHALSKDARIIPISILIQEPLNSLIFHKESAITKPNDITGKTVGYCVDGFHTAFLEVMFDNRGISPKKYYNASSDLISAIANRHVDILYGAYWNIEGEILRAKGVNVDHFPLDAFGVPPYYELIVVARQEDPCAKSGFKNAFQRALQNSIDYSVNHQKEAFEIYSRANPDKSLTTLQWEYRSWLKTMDSFAKQQQIDSTLWNEFVDWLIDHHLLSDHVKLYFENVFSSNS